MSKFIIPGLERREDADLFNNVENKFPTRRVFNGNLYDTYAIDLIDLSKNPKKKNNKTINYIMLSVELVSRKLAYALLTDKKTESLKNGINEIIRTYEHKPKRIWSDQEAGLLSKEMTEYLKQKDIILYHTYGSHNGVHNPMAETQIGTMKEALKYWKGHIVDNVEKYVNYYNNKNHTLTKHSPNEITNNKYACADAIFRSFKHSRKPKQIIQFEIGDKVRMTRKLGVFEKRSTAQKYTTEIFTIHQILNTKPITYKIKDKKGEILQGSLYNEELAKV
jgi:hypothetical protein